MGDERQSAIDPSTGKRVGAETEQSAGCFEEALDNNYIDNGDYTGTEQSLNGANYKTDFANQGADVLTTKLWFDVN